MIHVVTGAPCSGKSTYVQEHRKKGDVVIDFDKLSQAFGSDDRHAAPDPIKTVTFKAREAAITEVCSGDYEAWIIHTKPTDEQRKLYDSVEAEYIEMETDMETCLERCETDERPEGTAEVIRSFFNSKKGKEMKRKTQTIEFKAENGVISGYAATWIREPDSYGDVIAKGAFTECLEKLAQEGKVLPFLWNHDSYAMGSYIGTVYDLEEDDHGLKFSATFDDTKEAQRARELAMTGRVVKFSFAYDVIDQAQIKLEDGRDVNELRKLNIHEVSLVMYPANPDTGIIDIKSGRRNRKSDEEIIQQIISLAQSLLADEVNDNELQEDSNAKSEELDTANDEERKEIERLMKEATELLKKGFM